MKRLALAAVLLGAPAAHAQGDGTYELRATDATVEVGAAAAVSLTIAPSGGRTVSHDGPVQVSLHGDDGVALARTRYARKDAADPAADAPRFDLKLKATAPGDHALEVDVRFWLCGAKVCRPIRAHKTIAIHASAPAAPAP